MFPTQSAPVRYVFLTCSIRLDSGAGSFRLPEKVWGEGGGFSLKNINWKQKLKNFGISLGIGAASAEAGAKFYW
jgi:hypothetical protein